jgi:hypothetical protein
MSVITLSTDFGIADYAAGLLQGVIWQIAPDAEIVVLSHDIPRHDILSGSLLLERSMPYFPDGTVHIMVVDPGVGTQRRAIAARLGNQYFVGPDNGLLSMAAKRCLERNESIEVVDLVKPEYWLGDVSNIFHGRDIFSPVGAHLSRGVLLTDLGSVVRDPLWLELRSPIFHSGGVTGHIMHQDHFGNLSTNIRADQIPSNFPVEITAGCQTIRGVSSTFGDRLPGEFVGILDSSGHLAVCLVNGSAAKTLELAEGDVISVTWNNPTMDAEKLF